MEVLRLGLSATFCRERVRRLLCGQGSHRNERWLLYLKYAADE